MLTATHTSSCVHSLDVADFNRHGVAKEFEAPHLAIVPSSFLEWYV